MTEQDERRTVGGVSFDADPTPVPIATLFHWVIWQYPRRKGKGYYGAVRPANPEYGWFPAIIQADQQRVLVYANAPEVFGTPEAAAKYLEGIPL